MSGTGSCYLSRVAAVLSVKRSVNLMVVRYKTTQRGMYYAGGQLVVDGSYRKSVNLMPIDLFIREIVHDDEIFDVILKGMFVSVRSGCCF